MRHGISRRTFMRLAATGGALSLGSQYAFASASRTKTTPVISPGARKSKVRVAKLYLGRPHAHWPTPTLDLDQEVRRYETEFAKRHKDFGDVEFAVSEPITTEDQANALKDKLSNVDGVLAIHLSMGIMPLLKQVLACGKPTMLFAAPYSGHEWTGFGGLRNQPEGALLECMLTSDFDQLAVAVRPFRAIHHLREAIILNVTSHELSPEYLQAVKNKFGTEIRRVDRDRVLQAYNAVDSTAAEKESKRWMSRANKIVEPSREEIAKSCRLALAFEKLLDEDEATVITVDCYGSMYRQLPAFPCIGFTRLNDMGLGGICESDLSSAMTFIILQGLSGKPGFISDPTIDESADSIVLAHCLGSTKMDGPNGKACPYKLRCIMERQEGAVAQVKMDKNREVTQAILVGMDALQYFTGRIIDVPDTERGCRTKITVKVDGDIQALWQNWTHGLHRVTCYGDLRQDLKRFCRFKSIAMMDEAAPRMT